MELLEKTRKINKLLQRGEKVEFNAIARLLKDVIVANVYIVGRKGGIKGYALLDDFECDIMREQVLDVKRFPPSYLNFIMETRETSFQYRACKRGMFLFKGHQMLFWRQAYNNCAYLRQRRAYRHFNCCQV